MEQNKYGLIHDDDDDDDDDVDGLLECDAEQFVQQIRSCETTRPYITKDLNADSHH
jgi:hypothetical protein